VNSWGKATGLPQRRAGGRTRTAFSRKNATGRASPRATTRRPAAMPSVLKMRSTASCSSTWHSSERLVMVVSWPFAAGGGVAGFLGLERGVRLLRGRPGNRAIGREFLTEKPSIRLRRETLGPIGSVRPERRTAPRLSSPASARRLNLSTKCSSALEHLRSSSYQSDYSSGRSVRLRRPRSRVSAGAG